MTALTKYMEEELLKAMDRYTNMAQFPIDNVDLPNNFKQIVEQNGLKGLEFTKVGIAH